MTRQTPVTSVPFDLERAHDPDAYVGVTTDEGRWVLGHLHTDEMWLATGPTVDVTMTRTDAALLAKRRRAGLAALYVGWHTDDGWPFDAIVNDLIARGLLSEETEPDTRRRDVARWLAKYRADTPSRPR